jgi:hypothetical protein
MCTSRSHSEMRNVYSILIEKLQGNRHLGGLDLCRLDINMKSERRQKGYESVGWIHLPVS